jgi:RimJ/RimL family protein N-acetyltransferase
MKHGFPDHLTTARLRLRRLHRDDAESLCAYRSLPEVAQYQSWDSFGPDDAARLIESQLAAEFDAPGTWFQLAIVEAATDTVIGDCGLHCRKEDSRQMEIGITLSPQHQGRRYAGEAVECLLGYLFGSLDKHRVFASTDVLNRPAVALFQRLGFRQEAHFVEHLWFKGQWGSEYVFAMLKREWEERHTQGAATPNHALQRTAPRVTVAASSSSDPSRPSVTFP